MVGRFNVRPGDGDNDWQVWDNAVNGHRGRCPSQAEALALAADLELQYTVHGPRDQATVRRIDPPVPVDGWMRHVGQLDAWINEGGRWLGRVWCRDGRVSFLDQADIRPVTNGSQLSAGEEQEAP
ncbi:hypothetical protein [Kribbella sp. NBC_00889]|uniref:hypothetical protein n=1 Tax=Kribbella sp. NBC_00889 TaxID=2975974 RepID=UPI0038656D2E|nr:hypothetical protein OG817_00055 [Kribbella sp. NBC_00889]